MMKKKDRRKTASLEVIPAKDNAVAQAAPAWCMDKMAAELREAMKGFKSLYETRDKRVAILRTLSNPSALPKATGEHNKKRPAATTANLILPEANAGPIPHAVFRQNILSTNNDKTLRQILRAQFLRAVAPSDIYRILATVFTLAGKEVRMALGALNEPLMRALYRCRAQSTDREVLRCITAICARYPVYDIPVSPQLIVLGLKFAARTRSLSGMKKYLHALRNLDRGRHVNSNVFRATIAKFSIGHRGLGEIRNGRWRKDELLQVLTGFDDCLHLPPEKQYHLETFLDRSDWQYLHGWIAALARCRKVDAVWDEWLRWKATDARTRPKNLKCQSFMVTTKTRGDYWFIEQMTYAGGLEEAWKLVHATGMKLSVLHDRIKFKLLEGVDFCPPEIWMSQGDAIREHLLRKYDLELSAIEKALGVAWVPTNLDDDAEGYHVMIDDQETVMNRLGAGVSGVEDDFGYPWEGVVAPKDRPLHAAAEVEGSITWS